MKGQGITMDCIFCMIAEGTIPSNKVFEDDRIIAFYDLNPQAKVHVLVIPKLHIACADEIDSGNSGEIAYIFDTSNTEVFLKSYHVPQTSEDEDGNIYTYQPLTPYGKRIRAIPESWANNFGKQYYVHEQTFAELAAQSEADWKLRMEGQLIETGNTLNVTSFEVLRDYMKQELNGINPQEEMSYESI